MSDNPYSTQSAKPSDVVSDGNDDVLATPQGARPGGGYKSQMNRGNIIMALLFVAAGGLVAYTKGRLSEPLSSPFKNFRRSWVGRSG